MKIMLIRITLTLIALDQLTKYYVMIKPRLYIINDGTIFGIYGLNKLGLVLIIILSLVFAIVSLLFYRFYISRCRQSLLIDLFVIFCLSSLTGNTIDRLRFGGGIDFIDALNFYMNIADIYIYLGVIALIVELIINRQCEVNLIDFPKLLIKNIKGIWSKLNAVNKRKTVI